MSASIHPALLYARQQQSASKSSKMSITQTFYLAHKARGKLSSEAARSDHNLRLLVGHANLLDSLMLHLQNAEREQDAWFNAMVRGNSMEDDETDHMDVISEEDEEENLGSLAEDYPESESSDEDSDDDYELESDYINTIPRPAYDYSKTVIDVDEVEADDDFEEEEDGFYALRRTSSHAPMSPPELIDDDDTSDSDSNPPSPPQPTLAEPIFYESKNRKQISTTSYYDSNSPAELVSSYYQSSVISAF
ncbi:hypothetical protein ABW19_dt0203078 [Dactylella cylindrospora]|nr:hypothetical protein ABW19_dt0203078 [Dactylella cylindrospora]